MASPGVKIIATNRTARRDFEIFDTYEAGLVLLGSEVKSLRSAGKAQIAEAYARLHEGEAWLNSLYIAPYTHAGEAFAHDPDRPKKLLLHKGEIMKIQARLDQKGLTLIPLSLYFKDGKAKCELALARRKRNVDRRHELARREADREAEAAISRGLKRRG